MAVPYRDKRSCRTRTSHFRTCDTARLSSSGSDSEFRRAAWCQKVRKSEGGTDDTNRWVTAVRCGPSDAGVLARSPVSFRLCVDINYFRFDPPPRFPYPFLILLGDLKSICVNPAQLIQFYAYCRGILRNMLWCKSYALEA